MQRVLMISSEIDPFARTGGLGDVVGGLSSALADAGADVLMVTPRYGVTRLPSGETHTATWWPKTVTARVGWGPLEFRQLGVLEVEGPPRGRGRLRTCLLDHPDLFARDGIYGDARGTFGDNALRFVVMSRGALEVAARAWGGPGAAGHPDIIHAHDWHAAPAVISARLTMGEAWRRTRSVITIHNLAFQGVLGPDGLDPLALPKGAFADGTLAHDGQVNLLRGAIALADQVTTVSPTYAREIQTRREGCGLDALLRARREQLLGILNGIDATRFDPEHDPALASRYGPQSVVAGKAACKRALVEEAGLTHDGGPLFASVSRLTHQKGIDMLLEVVPALVGHGARVVLVGAGEAPLERALAAVAARFPGRVASRIAFDEGLARRIYAGADFFVVPSRYEPCGLTQLYAMRYGAIPIASPVGGLLDTVTPMHSIAQTGTGFVAAAPESYALLVACEEALTLFRDPASHRAAIGRAMGRDSSWTGPAEAYLALYEELCG